MPDKHFHDMTTAELIEKWHVWNNRVNSATSWVAALAAASKFRTEIAEILIQRGLVLQLTSPRKFDWK